MGGAVEAGNSERTTERRVKTLLYKRDGPTDGEREREKDGGGRRWIPVVLSHVYTARGERGRHNTQTQRCMCPQAKRPREAPHTRTKAKPGKKKQDKEMPHTTALVHMSFSCLLLKRTPAFISFHPISIYPRAPAEGTGTGTGSCSPANNSKG